MSSFPPAEQTGFTLDAYANVTTTAGTPAITKASSNVTSITDRAVGRYTINMTALASANYSAVAMCNGANNDEFEDNAVTKTATAFPIAFYLSAYRDTSFYFAAFGA